MTFFAGFLIGCKCRALTTVWRPALNQSLGVGSAACVIPTVNKELIVTILSFFKNLIPDSPQNRIDAFKRLLSCLRSITIDNQSLKILF
jgi:hypothetical protein